MGFFSWLMGKPRDRDSDDQGETGAAGAKRLAAAREEDANRIRDHRIHREEIGRRENLDGDALEEDEEIRREVEREERLEQERREEEERLEQERRAEDIRQEVATQREDDLRRGGER